MILSYFHLFFFPTFTFQFSSLMSNKINCPNCNAFIDVQDILAHQLEDEIRAKYQNQLLAEKKQFEEKEQALLQQKLEFEAKKKQENELFQERLEQQLRVDRKAMEDKLKTKLLEENADQMLSLQKELSEKSEQVKELNVSKAEIEKLKREKDELK